MVLPGKKTWVGNSALLFVSGSFFTYWILELGRSPGGGHGDTLQYSCKKKKKIPWAEEPRGLHGVTKSWTGLNRLSMHAHSMHNICIYHTPSKSASFMTVGGG